MDSRRNALRAVDLGIYAAVVGGGLVLGSGVVSLLLGAGAVGFKRTLFLVGVAAVGYATLGLKPTRPGEERDAADSRDGADTGRHADTGGEAAGTGDAAEPGGRNRDGGAGRGGFGGGGLLSSAVGMGGGGPPTDGDDRGRGIAGRLGDSLPASVRLPPTERLPGSLKLLVAGLLVLATSYALETWLDVGV